MLKTILLGAVLLGGNQLTHAQVVSETVGFDTYTSPTVNDLTTRFIAADPTLPTQFTQVLGGGISGGALVPPPTSGQPDLLNYCTTHHNAVAQQLEATICFKYNAALQQAAATVGSLGMGFLSTQNEDVRFGLGQNTISVQAPNYAQTTPVPAGTLQSGHWYRFTARFTPVGGTLNGQVSAQALLDDLGTSGTATPTRVAAHIASFTRAALVSATTFAVQFAAAKDGGVELLDNFTFTGVPGGSLCRPLGTASPAPPAGLVLTPNPARSQVSLSGGEVLAGQDLHLSVRDLRGAQVLATSGRTAGQPLILDTSALAPGLYVVQATSAAGSWQQKLVIE